MSRDCAGAADQSRVRQAANLWLYCIVAIIVLALSGCGELPLARDSAAFVAAQAQAQRLAEQQQHLDAARAYQRLAAEGPATERWRMATLAAGQYLAAGRIDEAAAMLPPQAQITTREQRLLWAPLAANLALQREQPEHALDALTLLPGELPVSIWREVLALEAQAHFASGDPTAGVRALMQREHWLGADDDAILANHRMIWRGLQTAGNPVFQAARRSHDDTELAGWLALGVVAVNAARNPFGVAAAMTDWQQAHPRHPANFTLVDEVLAGYRALLGYPQQLALILPLSGRQQGAALALRDGFMAAYFEHGSAREQLTVRLYDSAQHGAAEAYRRAVGEGADFIVGPLLREEVVAVAAIAGQVPTLALNQLGDDIVAPANLYQFALAPEDEAAQVARLAGLRHGGRAVALVPNDQWGQRLLASFGAALREDGGRVLEFASYDSWEQDYSVAITRMLHLDQSNERRRRLAAVIGTTLEFQPRRRQDTDFIFLAARAPQARLIRPQLRYFFAGDLPIYATSAVYEPGGAADTDLNGIIFPDAPWLLDPDEGMRALKQQIEAFWPVRSERLGRLYAMGFDAYRLVPLLFSATSPEAIPPIDGMSGRLTLTDNGRIHRRLAWAQFRGGRAMTLRLPQTEELRLEEIELEPVRISHQGAH